MSTQQALEFLSAARRRDEILQAIRACGPEAGADDLVRIGTEAGYTFTAEDLQTAFRHDWVIRQIRMGPDSLQWSAAAG